MSRSKLLSLVVLALLASTLTALTWGTLKGLNDKAGAQELSQVEPLTQAEVREYPDPRPHPVPLTRAPEAAAEPIPPVAEVPAPAAPAPSTREEKIQKALSYITYPYEALGYRINFVGPRKGYIGIADKPTKTITVYVRDDLSAEKMAHVIAHEIGHAIDFSLMTDAKRDEFLRMRGIPNAPWWGCNNCTDFSTGAGDFAEVFARTQLVYKNHSKLAGAPTDAQLEQFRAFIPKP